MQRTMAAHRARRDPRSPPDMAQMYASIPETCEFYGRRDRITRCRYPRSCRDCLDMDSCALDGDGGCFNATSSFISSEYEWDYQIALRDPLYNASYPYDSRYYVFRANSTDYCSATDPVCMNCTATFERLSSERGLGSEFCVGENGCVCVAKCEVSKSSGRYASGRYIYDEGCTVKTIDTETKAAVAIQLQPFTSRRRDPRAPLINIDGRVKQETCSHYSVMDLQGNAPPRTCQDCLLNKECAIASYRCVGMSEYRNYVDFRSYPGVVKNGSYQISGMFPAVNTTYCPSSDAKCSECRDRWKDSDQDDWKYLTTYGEFCVGETGCVCIQPCESKLWEANAPREYKPFDAGEAESTRGSIRGTMIIVVAAIVMICVWIVSPRSKKPQVARRVNARSGATLVLRNMLDQAPTFSRNLDLFGWRDYYTTLMEKERQLLRGEENVSPMSMPAVFDYEFVEATAPQLEFEEDEEASAPTVADPRALASAPSFYARNVVEENTPSAPAFEDTLEPRRA